MSATLPVPTSNACCPPANPTVNIPGAKGDDGDDGADGVDGQSAYALLTSAFTMPAEGASATVIMESTAWLAANVMVVLNGSYLRVNGTPADSTHASLTNVADTVNSAYLGNAIAGTVFGAGQKVCAAGVQGPAGALTGTAGGDLLGTYPSPTLGIGTTKGDLLAYGSGQMQRLGIGTDGKRLMASSAQAVGAIWAKVDLSATAEVTGAAGIGNGGTGQATKAPAFDALSPTTTRGDIVKRGASANERLPVGTANQVLKSDGTDPAWGKITAANMDSTAKYQGRYGILGSLAGIDLNSGTTDNAIVINSSRYIVRRIIVENASGAIATATVGLFTNTGGAGTVISADAALTLAGVTSFADRALAAPGGTATVHTASSLYFRVGTPEGAARTCTVWIEGEDLSA